MSYKVVVPGHGDISRVSELHASLETLYNNTRFDNCEVYAYRTVPAYSKCKYIWRKGYWTDFMKMEQGNESHVLLLLDDVKPRHNFSVERMIDAMHTFDLDMVSSAIQKFRSFVSPTLQPSLHCTARKVSFVDPLLLLFKRKAWRCWQKEINTTINRMGWGYSITFGSRCNASVGVIDTEVAVHANRPRLYSTTASMEQMRMWLSHAGQPLLPGHTRRQLQRKFEHTRRPLRCWKSSQKNALQKSK